MSIREELTRDRRLVILRILVEAGGSANESVLHNSVRAAGHRIGVTREVIIEDIDYLKSCGCVKVEWFKDVVVVATITKRGVAVAEGHIEVEGIKRPRLGD
jgi:hypothetical protein